MENLLHFREKFIDSIRLFFKNNGYTEVITPVLGKSANLEPFIEPIQAEFIFENNKKKLYLQTSPEHFMKRLAFPYNIDIFQISPAFRNGEVTNLHNPEFLILEWYKQNENYTFLMNEIEDFIHNMTSVFHTKFKTDKSFLRLPLLDLFRDATGLNLKTMLQNKENISEFYRLFDEKCEPLLRSFDRPVFIVDFPIVLGGMARAKDDFLCERFEFYLEGTELANGYSEITDAKEQRKRFKMINDIRENYDLQRFTLDEKLLSSMPAAEKNVTGCALGVERMMLLFQGGENLTDVLPFNFEIL